jgi:predicted transcriptional regulator
MKRTSLTTLREEMRSVARGERKPSPRPAAALFAALSQGSLDLLQVVLRDRPGTVAKLAEMTGRAQPNVSRSLQHLATFGLIRMEREGREVRPVAVVRTLTIDLETGTYDATPTIEAA